MRMAPLEQLEVHVRERRELDEALNVAEESLKPVAIMRHMGIEVTRQEAGRYSVAVSDNAPYGTTLQKWN